MPQSPHELAADEVTCLFHQLAAELHRFACRLTQGDKAAAEDLVQDVFCDVYRVWAKLRRRETDHQRAWLFKALKNKAFTEWRARDRIELGDDRGHLVTAHDETYEKAVNAIALERCWQVLKAMPPARYRVAYLHWHEALPVADIAAFFGIKPATVRVHLHNARTELIKAVGPEVEFVRALDGGGGFREAAS